MEERREVRREQLSERWNTVVGKETGAAERMESKSDERSGGKDVGRLE